jgi:O-antigen/teichoic acid export membrane protein
MTAIEHEPAGFVAPVVAPNDAAPLPAPSPATRRVGRGAMIYGLGIVMRRAATLIMLPVYTRLLTPTDYGLLQMLGMTVDVATILMSAGMTAGVMRFYYKAETEQGRREVIVTATALVLSLNLFGALLLAAGAGQIHQHVLGGVGSRNLVYLAAANFVLGQLLTLPMLFMQVQGRASLFSTTSVTQLMVQLTLNIVLLVVFKLGPLGILLSTFTTHILVGGSATIWMLRKVGTKGSRSALWDLRRFGVPYQIATVATFVLQFGDRFFLEAHRGLAAVGLYAFAYQFGFLVDQLATGPFMRAWEPRRFSMARASREAREAADNEVLHALTIAVVSLGLAVSLFVRPALRIIADPEYFTAANLVPIIIAAFVFQAWTGVVQFGIDAAERTRFTTVVMWVSAAVILALYALLIPPFGAYGAAVATVSSFALRGVLMRYFSNRVWPQRYDWAPQFRIMAVAVAAVVIAWATPLHGLVAEMAIGVVLFAAYGVVIWNSAMSNTVKADVRRAIGRVAFFARNRLAGA